MFSSNTLKIFFIVLLLGCQSCGFWRGQTNATPAPTPFVAGELKSEIPFSTQEPDVYQTEIVTIGENGSEEKTFAARSGANRLLIFDFQTKFEIALLQAGANQSFLIASRQKIYAENPSEIAALKSDAVNDFLTVELINRKPEARFETLGAENNLNKYRVILGGAANSEILIYVDANINLPVKQEFYSASGEQKNLISTTELKNFKTQTNAGLFEIPKDYRKISPKEFRETMRRERRK